MHIFLGKKIQQRRRVCYMLKNFSRKSNNTSAIDFERIFHVKPVILNDPKTSKLNKFM